jgi:hypothetical protein
MLPVRLFACALAYGLVGHAHAQLTVRSGFGADAAALT